MAEKSTNGAMVQVGVKLPQDVAERLELCWKKAGAESRSHFVRSVLTAVANGEGAVPASTTTAIASQPIQSSDDGLRRLLAEAVLFLLSSQWRVQSTEEAATLVREVFLKGVLREHLGE
jgi:hypothetical protein